MAKQSEDREDLLREATAFVERAEFKVADNATTYVIGFRRDGSVSAFLGVDPVYQFNRNLQLRRAYRYGFLIKAEQGHLVRLERIRSDDAVQLLRHVMSETEQIAFVAELVERMSNLAQCLRQGQYELIGCVPTDVDVMQRISSWLSELPLPPEIAVTPSVGRIPS